MRTSLISEQPKIRLKGKLIFIAISIYTIGAILDSIISLTAVTIIITRTILTSSSIISYIGWMLPEKIAKVLIKN